jgi:2-C-methyl-D-erythritol 4-phosphate cytidylyltransferase
VTALVVADGPEPDVLGPLHGEPVLVRTVGGLLGSGVVGRVVALVPPGLREPAERLLAGRPVSVCGDPADAAAAVRRAVGSALLVHDAARPLTPPALVAAVARAVTAHGVVVPVLPLSDTVKHVGSDGLVLGSPERAGLRVVQTPQGFAPELIAGHVLARVLRARPVEHAWQVVRGSAATVPGHPLAFPVRSAWDRDLAEVLAAEAVPAGPDPATTRPPRTPSGTGAPRAVR